jgi:hypothetical protein
MFRYATMDAGSGELHTGASQVAGRDLNLWQHAFCMVGGDSFKKPLNDFPAPNAGPLAAS